MRKRRVDTIQHASDAAQQSPSLAALVFTVNDAFDHPAWKNVLALAGCCAAA
jgi:hypothetical protein